jgi:hypothetical protein
MINGKKDEDFFHDLRIELANKRAKMTPEEAKKDFNKNVSYSLRRIAEERRKLIQAKHA